MRLPDILLPTWQVRPQIERTIADHPAGEAARICDIGAGGRRVRPHVFCVDVAPGPGVDLVADAHDLPIAGGAFDLVICTGTLNLCRDPRRALAEMFRVLAPRGRLHLEVGLFQPYNPEPEDYWRFTLPGLRAITADAGFRHVRSGVHMGPFAAFTNNTVMLASKILEGPSAPRKLARGAVQIGVAWLKYFDRFLAPETLDGGPFAYGVYIVAEKP